MRWARTRNVFLLATGAAAGYFFGRLLSERDFTGEQQYSDRTGLLLDLDDGRGFTLWTEVPAFAAAGPEDQAFVIAAAAGEIVFGGGVHSRRLVLATGRWKAEYT